MNMMTDVIQPLADEIVSIMILLIVGYATDRLRRWTGIEIEARHREALQSALTNAARIVVESGKLEDGIDYVAKSVPDALNALRAKSHDRIEELLQPHVARAQKAA